MTDKKIKNEQWFISDLNSKINNNNISKPKFQRRKKWDIIPKKKNVPDEQSYIKFLYDTYNSVNSITFGQTMKSNIIHYRNIDGNNRINAIKHFINKPFEIFPKYLDELFKFINNIDDLNKEDKNKLEEIFNNISYKSIIKFNYKKYFIDNNHKDFYNNKLKILRDEFEDEIEKIQIKLKVKSKYDFDKYVKINVNIFEGYNVDELCKIFKDINKYNNTLTYVEILACSLYNENNFIITDNVIKTEIKLEIKEYYKNKSQGEVLKCHNFNCETEKINAYDFIVSLQNLYNKKYKFINIINQKQTGYSLFFKLYNILYTLDNSFTTENVNNFIKIIDFSCKILEEINNNIFTKKVNDRLFAKTCKNKIQTLKKNTLCVIISSLIGFYNKDEDRDIIMKNIEKCLLYNFMLSNLKDKEIKEELKKYNSITYKAGGGFINNLSKNMLKNPELISNKITKSIFNRLIKLLCNENNNPHNRYLDTNKKKYKNDKRRKLKFYEKTLMFYYYKEKIPTNILKNNFSIEHIIPNSSSWKEQIDKDRLGNLIPIIEKMNNKRGNKHIKKYNNKYSNFLNYIKNVIPIYDIYDTIISHANIKPIVINNNNYNSLCEKNENTYRKNFINCLFN